MLAGGLWSMLVNLGLFGWALASGRAPEHAMTLCFVSLVLIELVKGGNFRSERLSVFRRPFANRWLNLAVLWEPLLLYLIVDAATSCSKQPTGSVPRSGRSSR